ncbi:MAG: hypothetical protein ACLQVL_12985 [Terriglobia bacterium]
MTLERARQRAVALDSNTYVALTALRLEPPREVFMQIRGYLFRRSREMKTENNAYKLLSYHPSQDLVDIELGPNIDKGLTPQHFRFDSGARLCFGLTLREVEQGSKVVAYRYQFVFPGGQSLQYARFDLNKATHPDPLAEPRCHLHPGIKDVRIPFSMHNPFEILDRIFFVLERSTWERK